MAVQIGNAEYHGNSNLESEIREMESCIVDQNRIVELLAHLVLNTPKLEIADEIKDELAALLGRSKATVTRIRRLSGN